MKTKVKKGLSENTLYFVAKEMFMKNLSLKEALGKRKASPTEQSNILDITLRMNVEYIDFLKQRSVLGTGLYEAYKKEFMTEVF